jgi:NAD(P)-dependent dehydrogenase (short-subunit alcohol dehydrogenase family)
MSKTIVITGASAGIGAATAELLTRRGDRVVLVARREAELQRVAARCGPLALPVVADVTVRDEVQRVVRAALEHFGAIDVWINNAGRGITRMPTELTDQDVDDMVRVNVKSVLYGMQEVLPHFKERGSGHIINISSMLGRVPMAPMRSAYSAAKHMVNSLTANFRTEVRATHPGIQFSLVSPGVVQTDFGKNALHGGPDSRSFPVSQTVDEVAPIVVAVIDSRAGDVYTRPEGRQMVLDYFAKDVPGS